MSPFCQSCTMPLDSPGAQGASDKYCAHCTDDVGTLKPRAEVQQGIAHWLQSWQGEITHEVAMERAGHFMKAMPAWADN